MAGANNKNARLKFNPFGIKGDIEEVYPQLKSITDGNTWYLQEVRKEERQGLQVFVILMYDPGSPLRDEHQDITKRKNAALTLAGIDPESLLATVIKEAAHPGFVDMVVGYLKLVNSRLWTLITINEQTFYEYSTKVMLPIAGLGMDEKDVLNAATIKTKLMEACDDIHKRLKEYYREFTGDDDDLEQGIERKKAMTPEQIAKLKVVV
jgi:DNA-binding protein Fis